MNETRKDSRASNRWHEFKLRLSLKDWYDLLELSEWEEIPTSEVLRKLIARRAAEMRIKDRRGEENPGWHYMVAALDALSRRTAALSRIAARAVARTEERERRQLAAGRYGG